jgi:hypothetical protein
MKKRLVGMTAALALVGMAGMSQATLTTIGTATYGGSDYKLIWDNDNNGNSVVWLDYRKAGANWSAQNAWAAGLDTFLTYNIDAAYNVAWDDDAWRLGSAENSQNGYHQTTTEMGHLFYTELGMRPGDNIDGALNAGEFDNLAASWYWSSTVYDSNLAWCFNMYSGSQMDIPVSDECGEGLTLRSGHVATAPVPAPATMLLFGTGLAGLIGTKLRRKKK